MIQYRVRSVSLLNLVNDVRNERLIPDAYFQRNLVWRDVHKKDFISTILMGLPFPQIFISKGKVDVETMTTVSCIVDGQQRSNAIIEYLDDCFDVEDRLYSDLSEEVKSRFLGYEIAVIELDLENDDPNVQEIFQRINRTSNSLTYIEKMASEYAVSEYMLVAKLLSHQINLDRNENRDFREDPNIPDIFFEWAKGKENLKFARLLTKKEIFTSLDIAKKAHLMHVLNIMTSVLSGFYNRNEKAVDYLNDYSEDFPDKDELIEVLERSAVIVLNLKLKAKSYWHNKANIFSLLVAISTFLKDGKQLNQDELQVKLAEMETAIPDDYKLAATEAVNSTRARQLRNRYITEIINSVAI
jgi:hypothetical protein